LNRKSSSLFSIYGPHLSSDHGGMRAEVKVMLLAAQVFAAVVVFAVIIGFFLTSIALGGDRLASVFSHVFSYACMVMPAIFLGCVAYIFSRFQLVVALKFGCILYG
jgi:hypothetical protein